MKEQRQQQPIANQIFGNFPTQGTLADINKPAGQMDEAMMQNMMQFFNQQMMQIQSMNNSQVNLNTAQQTPKVQQQPPSSQNMLEKFLQNKMSEMNQFYQQINIPPQQNVQTSFLNDSQISQVSQSNRQQPQQVQNKAPRTNYIENEFYPSYEDNNSYLKQTSKFVQPQYDPQNYRDEDVQQRRQQYDYMPNDNIRNKLILDYQPESGNKQRRDEISDDFQARYGQSRFNDIDDRQSEKPKILNDYDDDRLIGRPQRNNPQQQKGQFELNRNLSRQEDFDDRNYQKNEYDERSTRQPHLSKASIYDEQPIGKQSQYGNGYEGRSQRQLDDFEEKPVGKAQKANDFDERPVGRQQKNNNFNEFEPKTQKQYNDFDDRPVGKQQKQNFNDFDERPVGKQQQQKNQDDFNERPVGKSKPNINNFDELPVGKQSNQMSNDQNERPISRQQGKKQGYNEFDERPVGKQQQNFENEFDERPVGRQQKNITNEFDEKPVGKAKNSQPIDPVRNQQQKFSNPDDFDEKPIGGSKQSQQKAWYEKDEDQPIKVPVRKNNGTTPLKKNNNNFDDQPAKPAKSIQISVDDEQRQSETGGKKPFLKRGTRKFLSNAQQRSKIAEKEQAEIVKENAAGSFNDVQQHMQDFKKESQNKKRSDSPPIKSKFVESNLYHEKKPTKTVSNKENQQRSASVAPEPAQQQQQQKKSAGSFLTRGQGRGGGKGNVSKVEEKNKTNRLSDDYNEKERFDDDEEWGEETSYAKMNQKQKQQKKISKETSESEEEKQEGSSKLVQKFYGVEKPQKQPQVTSSPEILLTQEQEESIVRKYVQAKIDALNEEISKFKAENDKVRKSRIKYEDSAKQLAKEKEEWEKQKETEKNQLQEWVEEEKRKMQREKRVADRHSKVTQNTPSRKEREEMESLRKALENAVQEIKAKEQKHKLLTDRLKKQCEDLDQRNQELQAEVRHLESLRLQDQKKISGQNNSTIIQKDSYAKTQPQKIQNNYVQEDIVNKIQRDSKSFNGNGSDQSDEDSYVSNNEEENETHPVNDNKKVQFVQNSYAQLQSQTQPLGLNNKKVEVNVAANKQQGKQAQGQKNQYDLMTIGELGRISIKMINDQISEKQFCFDQNKFYVSYFQGKDQLSKITTQNVSADGKIQRTYASGKKEIIFQNGVKREVFPDGYTIVHFTNKDIKQTLPNSTIIYYFADANTTQTTLANGPNIFRFANKQIEIHFSDGSKEIRFCDGTEKYIHINGEEETRFSDGLFQKIDQNNVKYIEYPNGNVDIIHPDGQKVRKTKGKDN